MDKKFKEFDIELKRDLIAICTDGAQVMVSMGKLLGITHVLCMAHGLHLAVTDILYKKRTAKQAVVNDSDDSMEAEENEASETENESEDDSEDEEGGLEEEIDGEAELAEI